ncbi:MAG: hypothetical protein AB7V50_09525 [Vampirovibrionia bacterium]
MTQDENISINNLNVNFQEKLIQDSKHYINLKQDFITITEDRLRIALANYFHQSKPINGIITPIAMAITITITLCTAEFKNNLFFISASTWQAIFIIILVICIFMTFYLICSVIKCCMEKKSISIPTNPMSNSMNYLIKNIREKQIK